MKLSKIDGRRSYQCTVCGKVGVWDKNWSYYGSIAHIETCPRDIPYACSQTCRETVEENIGSGKWVIPKLSGGLLNSIVKGRKGY